MRTAPPRVQARRPRTDAVNPLSGTDREVRDHYRRKQLLADLDPAERRRFQKRQYWEEHRDRILKERRERYRNDPEYRARRKRESQKSYRNPNRRKLSTVEESRKHYKTIYMTLYMRKATKRWKAKPLKALDGERFKLDG